jgi:hypothetical protein
MKENSGRLLHPNEPQRHREHRGKKHREDKIFGKTAIWFLESLFYFLCVVFLCVLCASVVRSLFTAAH